MKTARLLLLSVLLIATAVHSAVPDRLVDAEFWRLVNEFSERDGEFPSENFVSNEQNFQLVLSKLKSVPPAGQAYLGVGPEQNFTYIAALRPRIAFIIDIRRQNLVEHLVYKAIFERSSNRSEFLAALFSRKPAAGIDKESTVEELVKAYRVLRPDEQELNRNVKWVTDWLVTRHGFKLTDSDISTVEYILQMFALHGAGLSYISTMQSVSANPAQANMPDFGAVLTATDETGAHRSFLASEGSFQMVRDLEQRNLIVPIVGDFGGDRAVRAVGSYLREHDTKVGIFYLSNVEQYLFASETDSALNGGASKFFANAATLPLLPSSLFIRSLNRPGSQKYPGFQSFTSSMEETIAAFQQGRLKSYNDIVSASK